MKFTIIDNVISKGYQNAIETDFSSNNFPWYFYSSITHKNIDTNSGFSHVIFGEEGRSRYYACTYPVLLEALDKYEQGLSPTGLFRIRAGMFVKNQTSLPHFPHIDHDYEHNTMLYYVNDSDGPTKIFSDKSGKKVIKEINPKKGRAVFFSGNTYHASSSPKKNSNRMIINYNFII
tara:strand:+ start:403 stop:930 length:528 start_codon:yes stop_codon:yes gene_type:complete